MNSKLEFMHMANHKKSCFLLTRGKWLWYITFIYTYHVHILFICLICTCPPSSLCMISCSPIARPWVYMYVRIYVSYKTTFVHMHAWYNYSYIISLKQIIINHHLIFIITTEYCMIIYWEIFKAQNLQGYRYGSFCG